MLFDNGSWAEKDVNPALFSRELMSNASSLVEDEEVLFLVYLLHFLGSFTISSIVI